MSMKISELNQRNSTNRLFNNEPIKQGTGTAESFTKELMHFKGERITEKLQNLLSEIDAHTQKIGTKFYLQDLIKYKNLVKDFLNITAGNSYQFSKESFLDRRGRHRVLSTIKKVNEELETLTKQFLDGEKDRIKILQKLDDIRGLLLDIFL